MGKINPENLLQFRSSQSLFDRISKRLASFDSMQLLDTGDFHKHVIYIYDQLGLAVYRECEAVIPVKDHRAKLPDNFKTFHAAYKCRSEFRSTKTINEQRPWIFMIDTEITKECPNKCKLEHKHESGTDKIVIRTFVNADDPTPYRYSNPTLLRLSPNVRDICTDDCPSLFCAAADEITIDDNGTIHTEFTDDSIYMQYYGIPIDENGLPMIPVNEDVEKAIEYYIYSQLFEEWYWNSVVPNIANFLQDARAQYGFYIAQARYWAKLPSFQKMINSVRRAKSRRQFFYSLHDRTIS